MAKKCKRKTLDDIWYKQQDEPIAIKNLGKEFRKKAKKKGCANKEINKYLKNW